MCSNAQVMYLRKFTYLLCFVKWKTLFQKHQRAGWANVLALREAPSG
jgi:hypothetical protein